MTEDYCRRTAVTRLSLSESQRAQLEKTIDAWRQGCQIAVEAAWPDCPSKRELQSATYDSIRDQTDLGSQHAILATHKAVEAVKSAQTRQSNGRTASKPSFTAPTIPYDSRTMTIFDDGAVSLATLEDRVHCQLMLPEDPNGYQYQYLNDDDWEITESSLTIRNGEWFLHIGFRRLNSSELSTAENGTVLGVDLGIAQLAVTSTGEFFSGLEVQDIRDHFDDLRSELQKTGTRSAYRTLRRVSERESTIIENTLHKISKEIVREAVTYRCTAIAFERLTGITDRLQGGTKFHTWAFAQLMEYVEYKAEAHGIAVLFIDPQQTSRRCSRTDCQHVDQRSRIAQDRFVCTECGYELHADYNAAKNIGLRAARHGHKSSCRAGIRHCALKSGTVTPNGGFSPYPDGFEVEFTDKFGTERNYSLEVPDK